MPADISGTMTVRGLSSSRRRALSPPYMNRILLYSTYVSCLRTGKHVSSGIVTVRDCDVSRAVPMLDNTCEGLPRPCIDDIFWRRLEVVTAFGIVVAFPSSQPRTGLTGSQHEIPHGPVARWPAVLDSDSCDSHHDFTLGVPFDPRMEKWVGWPFHRCRLSLKPLQVVADGSRKSIRRMTATSNRKPTMGEQESVLLAYTLEI